MSTSTSDDSNSETDISERQMEYFCTYCQEEITNISCQSITSMIIFVHCAICDDIYLCLMCFSSGAEIGPHKSYHDYKLVTFSKSSFFSTKLLDALEEWISEDTEKYIETEKLVLSWEDVADAVGVGSAEDMKIEYYNTFINGYLGQNIISLVEKHVGNPQVVTFNRAVAMGCFEDCPTYLPKRKFLKVPADKENIDDYEIQEEFIMSEQSDNKDLEDTTLDSYQVQLLLQCTGEFGYGNWEDICKQYNKTIHLEYPKGKRRYLSATRIMEEYIHRFIQKPILSRTWLPVSIKRPIIPDRTKRIEGPRCDYEDYLKEQLPIEGLDIFVYPPAISHEDEEQIIGSDESAKLKTCTYCQEEFEVINYRADSHKFSSYTLKTVYACCTNNETCENLYLCLLCFGSGAEIGKHKKHHGYKIITEIKTYSSEINFRGSNWTAIEEMALLYALEEWLCEHSDKYLDTINSKNCITDWESVAKHIRSKNAIEAKCEFENVISNRRVWQLNQIYTHVEPLILYEDAVDMGCFDNSYETNSLISGSVEEINVTEEKMWSKSELELLLEYTTIYGYGNWEKISKELNKTMFYECFEEEKNLNKRTSEEIKKEYLFRFYTDPIKRGIWKSSSKTGPIILDRTRLFKCPVDMKYPVMNYNLFSIISYNNIADNFEYPYMHTAECSLDNINNFDNFFSKYSKEKSSMSSKGSGVTKNIDNSENEIRTIFEEEKTLIALEQYNEVLKKRRIAKKCVHNYRLIEQFEMYKDKQIPKIKPFSQQTFGERLVKMSRFMTIDTHRALIEGVKNEKLLARRLKELKFYKIIGLSNASEIETFNNLQKHAHEKKLSNLKSTDSRCQTFNDLLCSKSDGKSIMIMKYIHYICSKISRTQFSKNKYQLKDLPADKCEGFLTKTEKMMCLKYNMNSNYYLKKKCEILNHGLREDSTKIDKIIYKYLVHINKINVQQQIL